MNTPQNHISTLEQFSIECRKTKTKVITLTNHRTRRQSDESIRTRSTCTHVYMFIIQHIDTLPKYGQKNSRCT